MDGTKVEQRSKQDEDLVRFAIARRAVERFTIPRVARFIALMQRNAKSQKDLRILENLKDEHPEEIAGFLLGHTDESRRLREIAPYNIFLKKDEILEITKGARHSNRTGCVVDVWTEARKPVEAQSVLQSHNDVETMNVGDRITYEMHSMLSKRIAKDPEQVLRHAESIIKNWKTAGTNSMAVRAWTDLLRHPVPNIVETIKDLSDQGQWLRSSSPLVSALTEEERKSILDQIREERMTRREPNNQSRGNIR